MKPKKITKHYKNPYDYVCGKAGCNLKSRLIPTPQDKRRMFAYDHINSNNTRNT